MRFTWRKYIYRGLLPPGLFARSQCSYAAKLPWPVRVTCAWSVSCLAGSHLCPPCLLGTSIRPRVQLSDCFPWVN